MENKLYKRQVELMLNVLPEVAKESCFALHGGTAINLFIRDMPRLSVDIDLTYVPIEDRALSLSNISDALKRIKNRIEAIVSPVRVQHKESIGKLLIASPAAEIKIVVNLVGRGLMSAPVKLLLCSKAQTEFDVFAAINVIPFGQLYGGKICAALDRQHPRDLFDVKTLLANEGFSDEVRRGFLLCLLGSDRPLNEVIAPNFQDQRAAMTKQFTGMTTEEFSFEEFEAVREQLLQVVHQALTPVDKSFLLNFKNLTPDWSLYDFARFPAVQWKMHNLKTLKDNNPQKHKKQYEQLREILGVTE